jgi:hypothetical protein
MSFIEFLLWKYDQPLPGLFVKAPVEDLHLLDELNATFAKARLLSATQSEHEDQIKALELKVKGGGFQAAKAGVELNMVNNNHSLNMFIPVKQRRSSKRLKGRGFKD